MSETAPTLGTELRRLRDLRKMSLQAVADATRRVTHDSDSWISQPYLSQLESGAAEGVSLPKLYALSLVYGVAVESLMRSASPEARPKLERQHAEYAASGKMRPAEEVLYLIGDAAAELASTVWVALAPKARNVQIPVLNELSAKQRVVNVIGRRVCVPTFIEFESEFSAPRDGPTSIAEFERRIAPQVAAARDSGRAISWPTVARAYADFVLSTPAYREVALAQLKAWTVSFDRLLTSYIIESHRGNVTVTGVPALVIEAVGGAMTALALSRRLSLSMPEVGDAPPLAGARAYLSWIAAPLFLPHSDDVPFDADDLAACGEAISSIARTLGGRAVRSAEAPAAAAVRDFLDRTRKSFEGELYRRRSTNEARKPSP